MKKKLKPLIILMALFLIVNTVANATSSPGKTLESTLIKAVDMSHKEYLSSEEKMSWLVGMMVLDIAMQDDDFGPAFKQAQYFCFMEVSKTSLGMCMFSGGTIYLGFYDEETKDIELITITGVKTNTTAAQLDGVMEQMKSMAQIRDYVRIEKVAVLDVIEAFVQDE